MSLCAENTTVGTNAGFESLRGGEDAFRSAFARVEGAVVASCGRHEEWPARIAAGISGLIDFLVANPGAARALAIDTRSGDAADDSDYLEMIGRFAALLGDGAPRSERLPASSDRSVVSVIAAIVSCHVRAGTIESLGRDDPDLVFLALLPYLGFAEAFRWSATLSPGTQ
jgi:hypothetical protein